MRMIRTVGGILLLIVVVMAAASCASAECAACKGSPSGQQELLNNEWAAFMEGNSTNVSTTYSSIGGLISPKISRQNAANLNTKSSSDPVATEKKTESEHPE